MNSDDALGGIIGFIIMATVVILVAIAVIAAFLSFLVGKLVNIVTRILFGWTLNANSGSDYVRLATISILVLIPIAAWIAVVGLGLSMSDWFLKIVIILCSFTGIAGYYAAHFGMSPDKFAAFQAAGIMRTHEQETKWFNTTRTNWYVFWHWTIAKRTLELDYWFKDNVTRRITGQIPTGS
jgi:hypothetical protein